MKASQSAPFIFLFKDDTAELTLPAIQTAYRIFSFYSHVSQLARHTQRKVSQISENQCNMMVSATYSRQVGVDPSFHRESSHYIHYHSCQQFKLMIVRFFTLLYFHLLTFHLHPLVLCSCFSLLFSLFALSYFSTLLELGFVAHYLRTFFKFRPETTQSTFSYEDFIPS